MFAKQTNRYYKMGAYLFNPQFNTHKHQQLERPIALAHSAKLLKRYKPTKWHELAKKSIDLIESKRPKFKTIKSYIQNQNTETQFVNQAQDPNEEEEKT